MGAKFKTNWPQLEGKPAVFLAEFEIPAGHLLNPEKQAKCIALFSGDAPDTEPGSSYFVTHYLAIEPLEKDHREHRLYQGGTSVAFQSKAETEREAGMPKPDRITKTGGITPEIQEWIEFGGDVMEAMKELTGATNSQLKWSDDLLEEYRKAGKPRAKKRWLCERLAPRFNWLSRRPRWTESEGQWTFIESAPMVFLGQVQVPKTAPEAAPRGQMIYLFCGRAASGLEFKVISQTCGEQTAEDHYQLEEMIANFLSQGASAKAASDLVKKGDRWAHRFLLDQADLSQDTLELLEKHGANRQLKDEAKARLLGLKEKR